MHPFVLEHLVRSRMLDAAAAASRNLLVREAQASATAARVEGAVRTLDIPGIHTSQALADSWAGVYGAGGLRIDGRDTSIVTRGAKLTMSHEVRTAEGARAGAVDMSLWRDDARDLHASWDWIELEPGLRRTGFGRAFMEHGVQRLRDQGVSALHLTAGLSDGGVVWARMPGMRFTARSPQGPVAMIVGNAVLHGRISPAEGWTILRSSPTTPGAVLAHGDLGVRALRGSGWRGRIDLDAVA